MLFKRKRFCRKRIFTIEIMTVQVKSASYHSADQSKKNFISVSKKKKICAKEKKTCTTQQVKISVHMGSISAIRQSIIAERTETDVKAKRLQLNGFNHRSKCWSTLRRDSFVKVKIQSALEKNEQNLGLLKNSN